MTAHAQTIATTGTTMAPARRKATGRGPAAPTVADEAAPPATSQGPAVPAAGPGAPPGPQRYVSQGRFGSITVEVVGDRVFVNGALVEPAASPKRSG